MKILFLLLLPLLLFSAKQATLQDLYNLSLSQKQILHKTYQLAKPFDLHLTMCAIAWKESSFGTDLRNDKTKDYGVFQINLKTFKNMYYLNGGILSDKEIADELVKNYDLNFLTAIGVLKYWQIAYPSRWLRVYQGYNGGYTGKGRAYAHKIMHRVRLLKQYFKDFE